MSVRATIESILKHLDAKFEVTYCVTNTVNSYFATWTVESRIKQRGNLVPTCTSILSVKSGIAPDFSFEGAWIELYAADLLPLAKKIAQMLLLTHNIRCMSVSTVKYVDHLGNKCIIEQFL